jgi:hypothetical protein
METRKICHPPSTTDDNDFAVWHLALKEQNNNLYLAFYRSSGEERRAKNSRSSNDPWSSYSKHTC